MEVPPWVHDACRILSETLGCSYQLKTLCWGPRASRMYVVQWQGVGADGRSVSDEAGAPLEEEPSSFGFLSDQEPLEAAPSGVQVRQALDGCGVCALVDASEMSSNEPHVLSAWAVAMLDHVRAQHGAVAEVMYTEWAALAGVASKAAFLTGRTQHAQHNI